MSPDIAADLYISICIQFYKELGRSPPQEIAEDLIRPKKGSIESKLLKNARYKMRLVSDLYCALPGFESSTAASNSFVEKHPELLIRQVSHPNPGFSRDHVFPIHLLHDWILRIPHAGSPLKEIEYSREELIYAIKKYLKIVVLTSREDRRTFARSMPPGWNYGECPYARHHELHEAAPGEEATIATELRCEDANCEGCAR